MSLVNTQWIIKRMSLITICYEAFNLGFDIPKADNCANFRPLTKLLMAIFLRFAQLILYTYSFNLISENSKQF